ncbi:heparinase II/III family protein [Chloroflexi bacterium TSY]|nr:heparinase II/III family protein [Chloroflexi bacterium TSY]
MRENIYQLDRQEILHRAAQILDHRFTFLNLPSVQLEPELDWRYDPTTDPFSRWAAELNRHHWWADLALAYQYTLDEQYAQKFVDLLVNWIHTNPLLPKKNERDPIWTLMNVGMRSLNWIAAFALFQHSDAFTTKAKCLMLRSLYDHARFLNCYQTSRNHLLRESNGLAAIAVYFPEFDEAGEWLHQAFKRLDDELQAQINEDGSQIECSTGYQWMVTEEFDATSNIIGALDSAAQDSPTFIELERLLKTSLEKMYGMLVGIIRPDGTFPQINDGYLGQAENLAVRLLEIGIQLKRDDLVFVGTAGKQGKPPAYQSVGYENAGLYVMRSSWESSANYLLFDAGPYGGPHGHEDKLALLDLMWLTKRPPVETGVCHGKPAYEDSKLSSVIVQRARPVRVLTGRHPHEAC